MRILLLIDFTGVKNVLVALMSQKAEVKYDPAYILPSQIGNKICALGFGATLLESESLGQSAVEIIVSISKLVG